MYVCIHIFYAYVHVYIIHMASTSRPRNRLLQSIQLAPGEDPQVGVPLCGSRFEDSDVRGTFEAPSMSLSAVILIMMNIVMMITMIIVVAMIILSTMSIMITMIILILMSDMLIRILLKLKIPLLLPSFSAILVVRREVVVAAAVVAVAVAVVMATLRLLLSFLLL